MAILIHRHYTTAGKFTVRVNRGLRAAKEYDFDSREEAEQFARDHASEGESVRSYLDVTDEELERREAFNRRAYNG